MAGEVHQSQPVGAICLTVGLLLTSAVHTSSISIGRIEGADPTNYPDYLRSLGQISIGMQPVYCWTGYLYFHLLKGGVMSENYRSQLANQLCIDAQGKKMKKLYIKRRFISLRCHLAVKRKTADIIPTCHCTKFGLKAMLCPHLTCIVPDGPRGKMLKPTAGC